MRFGIVFTPIFLALSVNFLSKNNQVENKKETSFPPAPSFIFLTQEEIPHNVNDLPLIQDVKPKIQQIKTSSRNIAPASNSCDPPFYFKDDIKIYKLHCIDNADGTPRYTKSIHDFGF